MTSGRFNDGFSRSEISLGRWEDAQHLTRGDRPPGGALSANEVPRIAPPAVVAYPLGAGCILNPQKNPTRWMRSFIAPFMPLLMVRLFIFLWCFFCFSL